MPLPVSLERELHPTVLDLTSRITLRLPIFSRNENAKDDFYTQSLIVMPGCTLEVWDKDTSPESKERNLASIFVTECFKSGKGSLWYAEEEEKKGANAGNLRDAVDRLK